MVTPAHPLTGRPRAIARWLLLVALLVFVMVVIGGITRLTESGLSMTRWEPVTGIIPPLSAHDWQVEFDSYRATPEYLKINRGMTLAAFKAIFFWEYVHRVMGRLIGLAFAVPFVWFAAKRAIPRGYGWRLGAILALGGLQGAIGWWMVASGLVDRPDVSHLRLATHLLTALLIFAALVWTALDLRALARAPEARPARLGGFAALVLALLAAQLAYGAFTAGLDAGYAYAEWPTMGGRLFPAGVAFLSPAWHNLIDQPIVVQFIHRWLAWIVALAAVILGARALRRGFRAAPIALFAALVCQISLGIATLLSGVKIEIAVTHQAMAVLLLASVVATAHALGERAR
ncbi:MAG TPA: COX15/CtaA family protein [Sphingomonadaceae bacterium]|nr:COX15/CtaA family protein [Sphingomonadaceae bacterium]